MEITAVRSEALQAKLLAQHPRGRRAWATPLAVASRPGRPVPKLTGEREKDQAGGVITKTWILEGSPVMFLQNLCPTFGLVNGTSGTVKKVVLAPGKRPSADGQSWPVYVLVHVPSWTGPIFPGCEPKTIPVTPVSAQGKEGMGRRGWAFAYCTPPHPCLIQD
jgi:hypothetical protein